MKLILDTHAFLWLVDGITEEQGTTEHTEYTEARHNGGRIYFRVFGVFCG
jgi:PIN domain nuclease of toxin-antitoxin system